MTETNARAENTPSTWIPNALARKYKRGETIIRIGSEVNEWIAISRGVVCLETMLVAKTKVAVASLWFGDVLGCGSPLGRRVAMYDVIALGEVETISIPHSGEPDQASSDKMHLYTATASRLNRQVAMRLGGNGPQRLVSVLATLGQAFSQGAARVHRPHALALPVAQSCLGQLAGLSRRQSWIYLGQLAAAGWLQTARTRIILQDLSSWLLLLSEVERRGLSCIETIEHAVETLSTLTFKSRSA